ncbi:MAG: hypothetical protein GY852_06370, partial [bacterium]|nr:hypothetical protein [bacterium]
SHHLISRLRLSDIERFVHDWYGARIKNKRELKLHADDLVRILSDPDSKAIRELAENPLLLTIICLVHRIDAVLPDERVVLYQKCTETLLNTWHAWRTRTEHRPRRNKDERRNRARMEAIAYWMHCLIDEKEEKLRTVVSFEDITNFLTEYIEKMERSHRGKPFLLAEEFLGFVKDEAGLLIEVGEGKYSFVHLTFQEYLAATHLRKSGEMGGMEVVWTFIENRCRESRWHEVIRLLTGALERTEAQAFLLERILPRMN